MPINAGELGWFGVLVILLMSLWGGSVRYLGRLRRDEVQQTKRTPELLIDLATGSFSGTLIGISLWAAGAHPLLCMAVSGIGGHAGAKLIGKLERLLFNRVDSFSDKS